MKRGNNRMNGAHRYAVYPHSENGLTLIDEVFE
jgi:hypothetical protein